jgi:C4-dicarboxylate-specific signal transduction histidine kinase
VTDDELQSQLDALTTVLLAVARGRFDRPAPRSYDGSAVDTLTFLVNSTAEEVGFLVAELEREREELRKAQERLVEAAKLAALGELAGGVAHELNQPLTAIRIVTELLEDQPDGHPADRADKLSLIRRAAERMSRIVDGVRTFARKTSFELARTDALRPLDEALALFAEELRRAGIAVERRTPGGLPPVLADSDRLQQVFVNLLANARDALRTGTSGAPLRISLTASHQAEVVLYCVDDSGPGIRPEDAQRIFDPFFTTKPAGQGSGLGLAVSLGIVQEHGGSLSYEALPEGGARFIVRIPVARDEPLP